ncbi:MAG TPA: hypothetical protein GX518_02475 [Firmicutes bacterium]|nr:hypothetical protein [Bacillota bacterium]
MKFWGYLLVGCILSLATGFFQRRIIYFFPGLSVWVEGPLLFFFTFTAGYLLFYLFVHDYWWTYLRHFGRDGLLFLLLGLVAAGAVEWSVRYIGESIGLAIPAVLIYLFFLYLTQAELRR